MSYQLCWLSRGGNESKIVWEMNCLRKQNGPDLNFLPGNDNNISNETPFYLRSQCDLFICGAVNMQILNLNCCQPERIRTSRGHLKGSKTKLVENLPFKGRNELLNKMNETGCRWWQNSGESKMAFSRRIVPTGLPSSYRGRISNIS